MPLQFFYVAVAAGAVTTFTYWWISGDKEHALIRTATVLIIACPHALGLAIPLRNRNFDIARRSKRASSLKTDSHSNAHASWTS